MRNITRQNAFSLLFVAVMFASAMIVPPMNTVEGQGSSMTFTTGETMDFGSPVSMSFSSGISMTFGTNVIIQFVEAIPDGILAPCDNLAVVFPQGFIPPPCSWWELLDPNGNPYVEFHVDTVDPPYRFHIDNVWPGPMPLPGQGPYTAVMKVDVIESCRYFVVHEPADWYPPVCSWWEIIDPETGMATGHEFHVDWTNESCEFHVDIVTPGPYILPFPWYEIQARRKIEQIAPCDWFVIIDPAGFAPTPCTWWEILNPTAGGPTGLEFHIDTVPGDGTFHIDQVLPQGPIPIPWGPTYSIQVRKKVDVIQPCETFLTFDITKTPKPCTWWKIINPDLGIDVEFHVDASDPTVGTFHVDEVSQMMQIGPPLFALVAEQKFPGISPCDWFTVIDPNGFLPGPCSWWQITSPPEWVGVKFHVDSNNGIDMFHIDAADALPSMPTIPPWSVTAEEIDPWYYKPAYRDYAPSGMPDFDQRQWGTYNWTYGGAWSHCGPAAVANSLWWLDSEFEPTPIPPPTINDGYPLVSAFGAWDDHDARNVVPLVEKLAWFMDTDGRLTGLLHKGTSAADMQAGLTHYLSWSGVNPRGDVNGDGYVNQTDVDLVALASGSVPGAPNWNMAADLNQDNKVNAVDASIVAGNLGQIGRFYEHTVNQPEFEYIEREVERCQDVVLSIGYWIWTGSQWYREDGHFVTVAGVDSQDVKIAISDPIRDAFENGLIAEGRIPIPHPHMPPQPPYTTHNDAAYVSQDIYNVMPIPPVPPGLPGKWALANFPPEFPGTFIAVIEDAVTTSPLQLDVHDIAVMNLTTCKDGCLPMPAVCRGHTSHINITVMNEGTVPETFQVTAYANAVVIGSQNVVNLPAGSNVVLSFLWNTTGYVLGNYTLSASVPPVPGEVDTLDNTFSDGLVQVTKIGDINCDGKVDMKDVGAAARGFLTIPGVLFYNPNADVVDDHKIDMKDIGLIARYFGT